MFFFVNAKNRCFSNPQIQFIQRKKGMRKQRTHETMDKTPTREKTRENEREKLHYNWLYI